VPYHHDTTTTPSRPAPPPSSSRKLTTAPPWRKPPLFATSPMQPATSADGFSEAEASQRARRAGAISTSGLEG
jgi:hypothetical protein